MLGTAGVVVGLHVLGWGVLLMLVVPQHLVLGASGVSGRGSA
ncbi:hypothetical protein [Pseudonocardia sp. N23]|nr:hypothetical protein [Pseudonocardia sp. N23]GAY13031.1 hypothetical protein TOK_1760 [Pseudonocardia sp. N23]